MSALEAYLRQLTNITNIESFRRAKNKLFFILAVIKLFFFGEK
ncbi:hypothetical protein BN7874_282 [Phage NCTB]|nr:hypothetical protein BN7874_282 [Phage NCTB]